MSPLTPSEMGKLSYKSRIKKLGKAGAHDFLKKMAKKGGIARANKLRKFSTE